MKNDELRSRNLNDRAYSGGSVVYWMSRDQRCRDNWALIHAGRRALEMQVPLMVVFCLVPEFPGAGTGQYSFMLRGLVEVAGDLRDLHVPFVMLEGLPGERLPGFLKMTGAGMLVTDFDPLRIKRQWKDDVIRKVDIPVVEVDAHNIIPCWTASGKQEYGAYTIRPKIHKSLHEFLVPFPEMEIHPHGHNSTDQAGDVLAKMAGDIREAGSAFFEPGERAAMRVLEKFIVEKLEGYSTGRNDPLADAVSHLSPYLHFGQISAQRVALEVVGAGAASDSSDAFLEELIVRRELSDNFCYYNPHYDSVGGFPGWAVKNMEEHRSDPREFVYSLEDFENARTHEALWNACQMEMVKKGKMHGYMRMYWAKKILEWSASVEDSLEVAITLNDRYELDGRDPNGYAGIAWAIGGVHDRAWFQRPVFGKIRYMNERGCRSKFDVDLYIKTVNEL